MTVLTPSKAEGATTKASEMLYVESEHQMSDAKLPPMLVDSGLNAGFVTDLLSAVLTHERAGRHLYRSVAERSHNPVLKAKYEEFGRETERHAELCEQLIERLGGNPQYVSPMARAVEGTDGKLVESTFLLSGSLDVMTQETAMLDAVLIAETVDHGHWELMAKLRDELPDGELRTAFSAAVDEVRPDEEEHLEWVKSTKSKLTMLQAKSSAAATIGMKAEEMVATVKSWLRS
jgi:rubrerythrin